MTLPFESLDLNEVGLLFLLVSAVSVIRERRVLPYLIAILGSLTHGWLSVLSIVGLLLVDRFHTRRSKWLLLLNSIGFAALVGAWVLVEPFRSAFLVFGLLAVSIHFRKGGLGVVVPLMLTHQFFPAHAPIEIVLAAAGFYLVIEEVLRLAKSQQTESVLAGIEIPIILAIFYPFKDEAMKLLEAPEALAAVAAAIVLTGTVAAVLYAKKLPFARWVENSHRRGAQFYRGLNRGFSEKQGWIRPGRPATAAADGDFSWFFWGAVALLVLWSALIAVVQGRVG